MIQLITKIATLSAIITLLAQTARISYRTNHVSAVQVDRSAAPVTLVAEAETPPGRRTHERAQIKPVKLLTLEVDRDALTRLHAAGPAFRTAQFSPDREFLCATDDSTRTTYVWKTETGKSVWTLPFWPVSQIAWSADGHYIFLARAARGNRVVDAQSGKTLLESPHGREGAWAPRENRLVYFSDSKENSITVCTAPQFKPQTLAVEGYTRTFNGPLAWAPDADVIAVAGGTEGLSLFDIAKGQGIGVLGHGTLMFESLVWSPDGRWLAGGEWAGLNNARSAVHVFDRKPGGHRVIPGFRGPVTVFGWAHHHPWILCENLRITLQLLGHPHEAFEIFDAERGKRIKQLPGVAKANWSSGAWAPDDRHILAVSDTGELWRLDGGAH